MERLDRLKVGRSGIGSPLLPGKIALKELHGILGSKDRGLVMRPSRRPATLLSSGCVPPPRPHLGPGRVQVDLIFVLEDQDLVSRRLEGFMRRS
jgi:hypothetical protein